MKKKNEKRKQWLEKARSVIALSKRLRVLKMKEQSKNSSLFEGAMLGDLYITRDGRVAVYLCVNKNYHTLTLSTFKYGVTDEGFYFEDREETILDIVSRKERSVEDYSKAYKEGVNSQTNKSLKWISENIGSDVAVEFQKAMGRYDNESNDK